MTALSGGRSSHSQMTQNCFSHILDTSDAHTSIVSRISNLLQSSRNPWVDGKRLGIRRQDACCKALWSRAWMLNEGSKKAKSPENGRIFWFDMGTVELLASISDVNGYARSALALVRYSRLISLKDSVMLALRDCGMESETPQTKNLLVRYMRIDLFTAGEPLQDEMHALSVIDRVTTEFNWTRVQDTILCEYLSASFDARTCPHQLSQTVKALLSIERPIISGLKAVLFSHIPDPSEEASLQKADIHDVDKLVMM